MLAKEIPEARKKRIFNRCTFRLFEEFLAVQYLVIARKNG
jgi:hypothetical protein